MITEEIIKHCRQHKYSHAYRDYWLAHLKCEISDCPDWSAAPHHIRTRGAGGSDEASNLLAFCTDHHMEIGMMGWQTFAGCHEEVREKLEAAKGKRYE